MTIIMKWSAFGIAKPVYYFLSVLTQSAGVQGAGSRSSETPLQIRKAVCLEKRLGLGV